jgi:hypothetical protein
MNNIRNAEQRERAFLKVDLVGPAPQKGRLVVRGELFDGTLFEVTVSDHDYEDASGSGLIPVGYIGDLGANYSEIVLPAPVLNYGTNVRVKPSSVTKWSEYQKLKTLKGDKK